MGFYPNPMEFRESLNLKIHVDKTELIALTNRYVNTEQEYICVPRPCRSGKSMALDMLAAYYNRINIYKVCSGYGNEVERKYDSER